MLWRTREKREFLGSVEFTSVRRPRFKLFSPEYVRPIWRAPLRSNQLLRPFW